AVDGAVKDDVVDAAKEKLVYLGPDLGQGGAEVVAQPGCAFGRNEAAADYVSGRSGHAVDQRLGLILADVAGLAAKAWDGELARAEGLSFGDCGEGVEVE